MTPENAKRVLSSYFSGERLERVLQKALQARNPKGYIDTVVRRKKIDAWKAKGAKSKRIRKEIEKSQKRNDFRLARKELYSLCSSPQSNFGCSSKRWDHWMMAVMNLLDSDRSESNKVLAELAGVSRDAVYQWLRRGLTVLEPHMSENLKKHVGPEAKRLRQPLR